MRLPSLLPLLAPAMFAVVCCPAASAGCEPLRFGYTDQTVAPYYLGRGPLAADPPGALAELTREAAAFAGCATLLVRMPPPRLRDAMERGMIDASSVYGPDVVGHSPNIVYPLDKRGLPDASRGLALYTVVFVRRSAGLPKDADPAVTLRGKTIGLSHGAPHIKTLLARGVAIDQGAPNPEANFEKLRHGRIDGFAISLAAQSDMDATVAARYGDEFIRLDKPLLTTTAWLALNRRYYEQNQAYAEALWQWYGKRGAIRLGALLKNYER